MVVSSVDDFPTPGLTVTLQCESQLGYALIDPLWSRHDETLEENRKYSFRDNLLMINDVDEGDAGDIHLYNGRDW